jgi:hypothetical protein
MSAMAKKDQAKTMQNMEKKPSRHNKNIKEYM